uniref:MFS domain-containing protein n=1 Tax=Angiostrongylus cantonensis TaxID=6313 RepID=A0A0K0DGY6_ANGCA
MEKLSGSIYLNSVYTGLMRYVCNLTLGYADLKFKRIGRKFVHTSGLVIIILSLAFVIIAHFSGLNHTLKGEVRLLILLASSMTSQIYVTTGVVGNELFPTPIRNVGYAFLQLWNRLGVIASPFVFYWVTTNLRFL